MSRGLECDVNTRQQAEPYIFHTLHDPGASILAIAADPRYIYTGGQSPNILTWNKRTFLLESTLVGHTGSVLALEYAPDKTWLFSASGDSTVRVWSTETLGALYTLDPHLYSASGDLFSIAWCSKLQTLYIGCQDTSLQWFAFAEMSPSKERSERKAHKFFDSYPQSERRPADLSSTASSMSISNSMSPLLDSDGCVMQLKATTEKLLHVSESSVIYSAHYGYLYCLALVPARSSATRDEAEKSSGPIHLLTGSGDECVKLWVIGADHSPQLVHTFSCAHGAVLSLAVRGHDTVFAGCQDGFVDVLDLDTNSVIRVLSITAGEDVLTLSVLQGDLYAGEAAGVIQRWSSAFECTSSWRGHDGIILSSVITCIPNSESPVMAYWLITGANDGCINIWHVEIPRQNQPLSPQFTQWESLSLASPSQTRLSSSALGETMLHALSEFIAIPSVSSLPEHREDCRQAAIWLKKCLIRMGAEATVLTSPGEANPLVLATFQSNSQFKSGKRLLFYGHYDVVSAPAPWETPPFTLSGRNGYLYGRGVTDNKGPILAVAFAAADLLSQKALGCDVVMIIEGEEENGSKGFQDTLRKYKHMLGSIDAILISNSTWIAENIPCITYGMRGVIHSTISISSRNPDLHSGVEGGAMAEPMIDMLKLLSTLTDDDRKIRIPRFFRLQTGEEKDLYALLASITHQPISSLSSRWREPALSVHNVSVSGPQNSTIIPSRVQANVSLRIVPDQVLEDISSTLIEFVTTTFKSFKSSNTLEVTIDHAADWWLGQLDDEWFNALETALKDEWGMRPLHIREGGSIPSVPFLEKEFGCHALHLPLGQSSGQAHLPNERMSLSNLRRGKSAIQRFFLNVGSLKPSSP